jgi:hypothetical protein
MTVPDEERRALEAAANFLLEVIRTPRVLKSIKEKARQVLRHYPTRSEINYFYDRHGKKLWDV